MDALLILGGLLLIVAGFVWLIVLAFGTSLLWGVGSLLPPIALVYLVRHWHVARKAIGLSGLGFIPLVVGFTLLANQEPERLAAIASLKWLEPDEHAQSHDLAIRLHGQLDGRPFNPRSGTLTDEAFPDAGCDHRIVSPGQLSGLVPDPQCASRSEGDDRPFRAECSQG